MTNYNDLIAVVREKPSELERWLVLADKLLEDGNAHGEAIANDYNFRKGKITGEDAKEARTFVLSQRQKVLKQYFDAGEQVPSYFMENDDLWMGAFPLKFPNGKEKLKELDGTFVTEEFPHYTLLPQTNNYASSVHQLRESCEQEKSITHPTVKINGEEFYRPFTFKENIQARVEDFYTLYDEDGEKRTLDNRLRLFNTFLDSCTGIAYKADSPNEFKLILQSLHLIGINENFNNRFIPMDYDSLHGDGVIKLNRNDGTYNRLLTQEQVLNQPAWNAAVEEDKLLLQEHTDIIFSQRKGKNMGFWLRTGVAENQLRALFVSILDDYSNAIGNYNLDNYGCFLRR
ncbi:MAG: hypothetical protein Q8R37_04610 [Nanoarchaeota archaeon]|nr:hypothetical protein [Nanoarchaeota archaeon]